MVVKVAAGCTITFGKDRYHQQEEMIAWCREHIGIGSWWNGLPAMPCGMVWSIQCVFGQTTFWFKNERDGSLFALKWL